MDRPRTSSDQAARLSLSDPTKAPPSPATPNPPTPGSSPEKRKSRISAKIKLAASEAYYKLDSLLSARKIGQETRTRIHSILNEFKRSAMRAVRDHISDTDPQPICRESVDIAIQTDAPLEAPHTPPQPLTALPPSSDTPATRQDLEEATSRILRCIRKHTKAIRTPKTVTSDTSDLDPKSNTRLPTYADKVKRKEAATPAPTPVLITRPDDEDRPTSDIRQDMDTLLGTDEWQEVRVRGVRRVRK